MSGPSDKAAGAALDAVCAIRPPKKEGSIQRMRRYTVAATEATHDPALGLDRSVCLRTVYDWMREQKLLTRAEELREAFSGE